ncbi:MAG TPA: AraC family transcriptional regulator [Cyclobacteriaceae bacterium]|nr:AraC family transcriptional regulator [Cyclobacteriaceae bacterium]
MHLSEGYDVELYRRLVRAKLYIETQHAAPIDLQAMAEASCLSRFHFLRMFKLVFGLTPHQYLMRVRVTKAMEFMERGSSVSEACYAVGLEGLSSFSRRFKQYNRKAPSVYLKERQRRRCLLEQSPLRYVPGCFLQKYGLDEE